MTDDRLRMTEVCAPIILTSDIRHLSSDICLPMTEKFDITLNINGRDYAVRAEARRTLVDVIRDDCGLTGTHIGCEHGICGACTIILDGEAVRACLMFAV